MTSQATHPQLMTNAEVSMALKISPTTVRSRIHRSSQGMSSPSFPRPILKMAGAWIWDRGEVLQFIAAKKTS